MFANMVLFAVVQKNAKLLALKFKHFLTPLTYPFPFQKSSI